MIKWLLVLSFLGMQYCCAENVLKGHRQLLVVTASDWEVMQGNLQLYERLSDQLDWVATGESIPVVLGKTGLAWGIGLHSCDCKAMPYKMEGDLKSPAGIFSLGDAFGFAPRSEMTHLKMEYIPLDRYTEAVDDPQSRYYNRIVNSMEVVSNWHSSEMMGTEPLYALGMVINHNYPNPQLGAGSAIFLHIWNHEQSGTAGCTAMSKENVSSILSWLDSAKYPVLVQLPISTYHDLKKKWNLPSLSSKVSPSLP